MNCFYSETRLSNAETIILLDIINKLFDHSKFHQERITEEKVVREFFTTTGIEIKINDGDSGETRNDNMNISIEVNDYKDYNDSLKDLYLDMSHDGLFIYLEVLEKSGEKSLIHYYGD